MSKSPPANLKVLRGLAVALLAFSAFLAAPAICQAAGKPSITITIDDTAITRLLHLIAAHDDSDASINAWIDLPGNAELLKVGSEESELTRDQLFANAKAVIDGAATDQTQPRFSFGRLLMSPVTDYQSMIDDLHQHAKDWLTRCANRDALYAPDGAVINQTVYLHLGGDWDAINRDNAIFIDMAFFHDSFAPSWQGLNLLIAHETFHGVQNQIFGNPESAQDADSAYYTALSKTQREGTARWIEVETDPEPYGSNSYGFFFRAVDLETIRAFPQAVMMLAALADSCYPQFKSDVYQDMLTQGLNAGGPYYTIGEGMAAAIEHYNGRKRLIETVRRGPLDFFDCYAGLTRRHSELPQIPPNALEQIERLRGIAKDGKLDVPNQVGMSAGPKSH